MDSNQLNEIFRMAELSARYTNNNLTENEKQELEKWIGRSDFNKKLFEDFIHEEKREQALERLQAYNLDAAWEKAKGQMKKRPSIRLWWQSAAAVLILAIGLMFFFWSNDKSGKQIAVSAQTEKANDVPPGGNKAVLTLANGKQIVLDSNANGILAQQGNTRVINLSAGKLAYKSGKGNAGANKQLQYNTLTTPRGGQYRVTLPDGSIVWLNAESSLKYPTEFSGRQRIVKLTGEAYFEVAENENMPLKVELSGMEIKVLGTHFNVMAYENEKNITTTLLEGKVKVTEAGKSKLLKPGQAASFDKASQRFSVATANTEQAIAWKNGYFDFREATLKTVMRQLSRWYNVEVQYQGDIPVRRFTGEAPRDLNLSDVLKILATSGIHFSIENKQIIVKP